MHSTLLHLPSFDKITTMHTEARELKCTFLLNKKTFSELLLFHSFNTMVISSSTTTTNWLEILPWNPLNSGEALRERLHWASIIWSEVWSGLNHRLSWANLPQRQDCKCVLGFWTIWWLFRNPPLPVSDSTLFCMAPFFLHHSVRCAFQVGATFKVVGIQRQYDGTWNRELI